MEEEHVRGEDPRKECRGQAFHSIESAHEYLGLLLQTIEETASEVGEDLRGPRGAAEDRLRSAFQLIAYKLEQLRVHVATSRRLLNDLRTLRRMLYHERARTAPARVYRMPEGGREDTRDPLLQGGTGCDEEGCLQPSAQGRPA